MAATARQLDRSRSPSRPDGSGRTGMRPVRARNSSSARAISAVRASAAGTDGPNHRSRPGSTSCRIRFRGLARSSLDASSTCVIRVIGQPRPHLLPSDVEKRTHDGAVPGIDAGEPAGSGAPDQLQQHGFGLIVPRVADGHPVGPERLRARVRGPRSAPGGRHPRASGPSAAADPPHVDTLDVGRQTRTARRARGRTLRRARSRPPEAGD